MSQKLLKNIYLFWVTIKLKGEYKNEYNNK